MSRPDGHAPIGVMGDHLHKSGEWMLSYRYMHMSMEGNRKANSRLSTAQVLADFAVSPVSMDMGMHMVGGMYAVNDELTLMFMLPYIEFSMEHVTRMGGKFTTTSAGIGDIGFSGLYSIYDEGDHRVHLNMGFSAPTGSIEERDDTPLGNVILPYPMQIGSGSYSLLPGMTYNGQTTNWSWGGQLRATIRLDDNDENYRSGDRINLTAWFAKRWNKYISTSLRLESQAWSNIEGANARIATSNPMGVSIVPTAQTHLRGGSRTDAGIGVNFYLSEGVLGKHRLALEATFPLQQNLDGPQLETDWVITAGWQKAF